MSVFDHSYYRVDGAAIFCSEVVHNGPKLFAILPEGIRNGCIGNFLFDRPMGCKAPFRKSGVLKPNGSLIVCVNEVRNYPTGVYGILGVSGVNINGKCGPDCSAFSSNICPLKVFFDLYQNAPLLEANLG